MSRVAPSRHPSGLYYFKSLLPARDIFFSERTTSRPQHKASQHNTSLTFWLLRLQPCFQTAFHHFRRSAWPIVVSRGRRTANLVAFSARVSYARMPIIPGRLPQSRPLLVTEAVRPSEPFHPSFSFPLRRDVSGPCRSAGRANGGGGYGEPMGGRLSCGRRPPQPPLGPGARGRPRQSAMDRGPQPGRRRGGVRGQTPPQ